MSAGIVQQRRRLVCVHGMFARQLLESASVCMYLVYGRTLPGIIKFHSVSRM